MNYPLEQDENVNKISRIWIKRCHFSLFFDVNVCCGPCNLKLFNVVPVCTGKIVHYHQRRLVQVVETWVAWASDFKFKSLYMRRTPTPYKVSNFSSRTSLEPMALREHIGQNQIEIIVHYHLSVDVLGCLSHAAFHV